MIEQDLLQSGIAAMGLSIAEDKQAQLLQYLDLLKKWNKVYNLTAVRESQKMVVLHLLDSLSVLPYINDSALLDVGSGAGLPGIVLAIVKPELAVTTIDTVQKKTIFMRQVKGELGLDNLTVVNQRVEQYKPEHFFGQIISRAFSEINLFIQLSQHLLAENGRWLAMKGVMPEQELQNIEIEANIIPLDVAHLEAERHLVIFENHS